MGYAGSQFQDGPGRLNDPLAPFGPPVTFCNEEQTVTLTCPDGTEGDPVSATVDAGELCGYATQELANAAALAQATAEAQALRDASPCVEPEVGNVLWGWGRNFRGSLGVGNTAVQEAPVIVGYSALDWVQMAHGSQHGGAVMADHTLQTWGQNFYGQLGLGTQSVFPSTANNKLVPTKVGTDDDWLSVACGESSSAGVKTDGTLWVWGNNSSGELGLGNTTIQLSPVQVGSDTDWAAAEVATTNLLALKTDGTIWGSGNSDSQPDTSNIFEQIGSSADWAFIAVQKSGDASYDLSCGIKEDGTLWFWGVNLFGGAPTLTPQKIGTDTDWAHVAIGGGFIVAVKTDGTMWSVGENGVGQLGLGDLVSTTAFAQIGADTDWDKSTCGEFFGAAIKTTGELFGWGINTLGQLGQGGLSGNEPTPLQMGSDEKWSAIVAGFDDVTALRTDLTDPAPPPGNNGVASGGAYSTAGGYSIHRFQSNGTFVVYADTSMDYLIVGGGGAGGAIGGGGAGQVQRLTGVTVPAGTYDIAVAQKAFFPNSIERGEAGGDATFNGTTSIGGGGGGGISDTTGAGGDGASGGGGGTLETAPFTAQPPGTGSAGNDGGDAVNEVAGGGGGGSGAVGGNASSSGGGTAGAGGAGTSDSITGTATFYGAGGGGGGIGAGGAGGSSVGGYGATNGSTSPSVGPITPGSGGGGAAGNALPGGQTGTDGAYGCVIIRYLTPP